jgi:hypothetical protein
MSPRHNDWNEYKNLVLDFKTNTEKKLDSHDQKLDRILESLSGMKVKIGLGVTALSGFVTWLVVSITK